MSRRQPPGLVTLGAFALLLAACRSAGSPVRVAAPSATVPTATPGAAAGSRPSSPNHSAAAATSPPTSANGDGLETVEVTGRVIDTGIDARQQGAGGIGAFNSHAVAGGHVWLASPNGLVRLDPAEGSATLIDDERGASVAATEDGLWRAAFYENRIRALRGAVGRATLGPRPGRPAQHLRDRRRRLGLRACERGRAQAGPGHRQDARARHRDVRGLLWRGGLRDGRGPAVRGGVEGRIGGRAGS